MRNSVAKIIREYCNAIGPVTNREYRRIKREYTKLKWDKKHIAQRAMKYRTRVNPKTVGATR